MVVIKKPLLVGGGGREEVNDYIPTVTDTCFINRCFSVLLQLFYSPMRDPSAAENLLTDPEKQAFFLMTNIKMVLVKFITSSEFDPATITESLKRSFYFSVKDWDVLASCFCNGQASECDPNVSWI